MSDRSTAFASLIPVRRAEDDHLVDFLHKLAQFSLDQCLHLMHVILDKQRVFESIVELNRNDQIVERQQVQLENLLLELQRLKNDLHQNCSNLKSPIHENNEVLFHQLQNHLTKFVEINLQLQTIDLPTVNDHQSEVSQSTLELPSMLTSQKSPSTLSLFSSDHYNDIGKCWKFASIIHTRCQISLIASNSQDILCYHQATNMLHCFLLTGQFQTNLKWQYEPMIDLIWCALLDRYLALTRHSIYTIDYDRVNHSIEVHEVLDINPVNRNRIACNQHYILIYSSDEHISSIQIYDQRFQLDKVFHSVLNKNLPVNSLTFGCTNTFLVLIDKENISISYFPYIAPKMFLLLFDIETCLLRYTIDLHHSMDLYSMKCLEESNIFFVLAHEKTMWIIHLDSNDQIHLAKKTFYTNQTEMCIVNEQDLLLINANSGHTIQLIKYRPIKS